MLLQYGNSDRKRQEMSDLSLLEKLRWSLNQRLCEQMRLLNSNFFDEVDDFLFTGGQHGQFIQDSVCLKSMREIRAKQELFEQTFLTCIGARLQDLLPDESAEKSSFADIAENGSDESEDAVYEQVEIDLAFKTMQRKAYKFYLPFIKRLENLGQKASSDHDLKFLQRDILVENTIKAFSMSQDVFNLTLEARLILLKLFERHFLMKMEKLFLDTIRIISNIDDQAFIDKLYSSSASFKSRQTNLESCSVQEHRIDLARQAISRSEEIEERISLIIAEIHADSELPNFIASMIDRRWRAILFIIGLNNGLDGAEFAQATDSIRNLVELVLDPQIKTISSERIKEQVRKGFHLVQCPQDEQDLFFNQLEQSLGNRNVTEITNLQQSESQTSMTNTSTTEAAVSPFAEMVLDSDDLNELAGLLDNDNHSATENFSSDDESMTNYLADVDQLRDGVEAEYSAFDEVKSCRIYHSSKVDNNYQIKDKQGKVMLTRSRLGLAVSLREGELRLVDHSNNIEQHTVSPHIPAADSAVAEVRQITVVEENTQSHKP